MSTDLPVWVPGLDGVLSIAQVAETAASIAAVQEASGAVPWSVGGHTDVWNHVEAAMALLVGGQVAAAEHALEWCRQTQRADGSWPMRFVDGEVTDPSGETNMSAYLAVGIWHHWLIRADADFVGRHWPTVRRALDWVVSHQLPFGGISWSQEWSGGSPGRVNEQALLAGSSSIHHSLRAGLALADLVGEPQPEWELAGGRLLHALREHRDLFLDKSTFSMDWYYPVLGGAVRGEDAVALLKNRWDDFVEPGLGIRCVDTNPWVTGAETCELALALEAIGDRERARELLLAMQHLRGEGGAYWTGFVFGERKIWPEEHTTYTAAAVILAVDALAQGTPGADVMRGASLPELTELPTRCGCEDEASADRVAGEALHSA